jgi:phage repressor protein C with HTH and peptisase S24 domain
MKNTNENVIVNLEINKNIKRLIEKLKITPYEFSKQIGNKRADNIYNVINGKVEVSTTTINKIFNRYPEYKDFILSGNMSNDDIEKDVDIIYVPLLPISAQGGSLNDFVISVKGTDCEKIISPIKGVDFAVTVSGDSMAPEYPSGSQVLIKRINEKAFIDWGKVYVLDTCNGTVIKILVPSEKEGYVKCMSINQDEKYASFDVAFSDIYSIYRVLLCMAIK